MPRPGFVLEVDRSTPPILFWRGENFSLEKLPAGRSRVIYPPEPLEALDDIDGAIRNALLNPHDQDPLPGAAVPRHEADDRLRRRQPAAAEDAHAPTSASGSSRPCSTWPPTPASTTCTSSPRSACTGGCTSTSCATRWATASTTRSIRGMLYQHDAEDYDNLTVIGTTPEGEVLEISKRAADSDLIVYVNINSVAMDGGWKSITTGLASYRSLSYHHNPETLENTRSLMDRHKSELHKSVWRLGKVLRDHGPKVFQIETTLNTDMFPSPFDFLNKREWEWKAKDRATFLGTTKSLSRTPIRLARKIFHTIEGPHQMTSVQAGETEAVHKITLEKVHRQQLVEVHGSDRHPHARHPLRVPVQPRRDHEPGAGDVHGPRLPVQHVPQQAAGA